MEALSNLFYFILALGILVTFHEYGHFWVARKLGVKVLVFSVGFGKPIWQRRSRDGVNYQIAAIPLGGYVKMLDERAEEVAEAERHQAFNRQSVWVRMAIVLAGPVANFLLAIVLYWWMFALGITGLTTTMGQIEADSIAGKAGLKAGDIITQIDEQPVELLDDVLKAAALRLGERSLIELKVDRNGQMQVLNLDIRQWQVSDSRPQILDSLGIRHAIADLVIEPIVGQVTADTPAERAGLAAGDRIVSYQQTPVDDWQSLVRLIQQDPGKEVLLQVLRNGELSEISVVIGSHKPTQEEVGFLGVYPQVDRSQFFTSRQASFIEAFSLAVAETGKMISLTAQLFKKLLIGDISVKSISGPLSIAEGAGGSARSGLVYFLSFVAMISVNLGFINLLPIPLLDGGHLLYFSIEAIKGKPLSEKTQEIGLQVGMLLVFMLMAVAIFNDLSQHLF